MTPTPESPDRRGRVSVALQWLVAAAVVVAAVVLATQQWYQWDFKAYYAAALAFLSGRDPYDTQTLTEVLPGARHLPFVYPPATLYLFAAFTVLPLPAALFAWALLKAAALLALLALWRRRFVGFDVTPLLLGFLLVAYRSPLTIDLVAGNVNAFEQLALFAAFVAFLRRRFALFWLLLTAASLCKLSPLFFLLVFVLLEERPDFRRLALAATGSAAVLGLNLLQPGLVQRFLQTAPALDERRIFNPCLRALLLDLRDALAAQGVELPVAAVDAAWALSALALLGALAVAWLGWRRRVRAPSDDEKAWLFCLLLLTYALLLPRLKDYSYAVVLAPSWIWLRTAVRRRAWRGLAPLGVVSMFMPGVDGVLQRLEAPDAVRLALGYSSLFALLIVWRSFWQKLRSDRGLFEGPHGGVLLRADAGGAHSD